MCDELVMPSVSRLLSTGIFWTHTFTLFSKVLNDVDLHTVTRISFTKSPVLPWNNKEFNLPGYHVQDKSAIELTNFFEVPPADFHLPCCANTHSINFCSDS